MDTPMKGEGIWLSTALTHVRDGVIGVDRAGEIVWMNPAAERLTGWRETDVAGRAVGVAFDALEKSPLNPLGTVVQSVLDRGAAVHEPCHEFFPAGNRPVRVAYTIAPVLQGGECRGAVIVLSEKLSGGSDTEMGPKTHDRKPEASERDVTRRVLVMDDDSVVLNLTIQKLIRLGYESDGASNGEEAVSKYKAAMDSGRPFDVVVLDLMIRGGLGGRETLEMLKDVDPGVRAVLTSGHALDPVLTNFWEYGFYGVIRKPFVIRELDVAIRQALAEE